MKLFSYRRSPANAGETAQRAARRGLDWLWAMQACFQIRADHGTMAATDGGLPWRIKPLGELIFLLLILDRHGAREPNAGRLRNFATEQVKSFDWHMLAANDPSAASPVAMVSDFFGSDRKEPAVERDYLAMLIDIDYFQGMDRLAYRSMDLIHVFWKIGRPDRVDDLRALFAETAFGRGQMIARYTIDDIYSLTHALFYITDLGQRAVDVVIGPKEVTRLRRDLVALTAVMMRADNFDVLGELLICWVFCRLPFSEAEHAVFLHGVALGMAAQAKTGAVASTAAQRRLPSLEASSFHQLYHTTLVWVILFSVARNRM